MFAKKSININVIKATQTRDELPVKDQRARVRGQPTARREQRLIVGRLKVILLPISSECRIYPYSR